MATGITSWSKTAANNATADSAGPFPEGMAPSAVNDGVRGLMASGAKYRDDVNGSLVTSGSSTAYTVTSNQVFGSLAALDGQSITITMDETSGATPTLAVDGLTAKPIRHATGATLPTGALLAGSVYRLTYGNSVGEFLIDGAPVANTVIDDAITTASIQDGAVTTDKLSSGAVTPVKAAASFYPFGAGMINGTFVASVGSSALTIALKTLAGTDPSATDPVQFLFRNATAATGDYAVRSVTAALSIVIPSTATMGFSNATPGRIWVEAIDNAGTVELAVINCLSGTSIYPLQGWGITTTTTIGTGSDSAHIPYSATGRTSVAYIPVAYLTWEAGGTMATAGTWNAVPTRIQMVGPGVPLPGAIIQTKNTATGEAATGVTEIPYDDTIPQITEGVEYMTVAITPSSSANLLKCDWSGVFANDSAAATIIAALFANAAANSLGAVGGSSPGTSTPNILVGSTFALAGQLTAYTFRLRAGSATGTGGTTTFNGGAAARKLGGVLNSYMNAIEIMA